MQNSSEIFRWFGLLILALLGLCAIVGLVGSLCNERKIIRYLKQMNQPGLGVRVFIKVKSGYLLVTVLEGNFRFSLPAKDSTFPEILDEGAEIEGWAFFPDLEVGGKIINFGKRMIFSFSKGDFPPPD